VARPLPEPVLFLDECLGTSDVAQALRVQGARVEVFLDHFASATLDKDWLPVVGRTGWVVLTKDKWIRRRQVERNALMSNSVAAFVLTSGDLNGADMGRAFASGHPRVRKLLRDFAPSFIASVDSSGRVHLLTNPQRRGGFSRGDTLDR
jgi:hypothetical protein